MFCLLEVWRDVDAEIVEGLGGRDPVGPVYGVRIAASPGVPTQEVLVGVWGLESHQFGLRWVCREPVPIEPIERFFKALDG